MPISLKALLNDVVLKNASDLHIGVGVPPVIRIDGTLRYVEGGGIPTGLDIERALLEVMNQGRLEVFKEENELDFSFTHTGPDSLGGEALRGLDVHQPTSMVRMMRQPPE